MNNVTEVDVVYVVQTDTGFTETFDLRTINTLVSLGLIYHQRDGHVLEDSSGAGVGALHRFYRRAA